MLLWDWHPLWINTCLLDVYCHPAYWQKAPELLEQLSLPQADRYIAFTDANQFKKQSVLEAAGFRETEVLKNWAAIDAKQTAFTDVFRYQRL